MKNQPRRDEKSTRAPLIHDAKLESFLMPMAGSLAGLVYLNGRPLTSTAIPFRLVGHRWVVT